MSKQTPLEVWDNFDIILKNGKIGSKGFDLRNETDGLDIIKRLLHGMTSILMRFDEQWTELFRDDAEQMNLWKFRLRVFYLAMQNVKFAMTKTGEPDWDNIALDIGFMNAFRTAAELALDLYQSEQKRLDTTDGA